MSAEPMPTVPITLGTWPTPLEPAPRLGRALGLGAGDLWVKRDDLTGLGGGGNKVRKLEWLCAAALADGADTLITCGARQSNHARLTAAAGARLGLRVVLVLAGTEDGPVGGNLALNGLLGATVVWAGDVAHEELGAAALSIADDLRAQGGVPAIIPYGGSSLLGAQGYVICGRELLVQAPELHTVVTAIGSGGTMAGLVHALGAGHVLGVDCGAVHEPALVVAELVSGLSGRPAALGELQIRREQVGAGYAELTEAVMSAVTLAARTEGLILDPIYTGRALAGLARAVEEGQIQAGRQTVLLHSGGLPGLFGHEATVARAAAGIQDLPAS